MRTAFREWGGALLGLGMLAGMIALAVLRAAWMLSLVLEPHPFWHGVFFALLIVNPLLIGLLYVAGMAAAASGWLRIGPW